MAKRPLNLCGDCGYTWHPRGRDLSRRCPECKGEAVDLAPTPVSPVEPPEPSERLAPAISEAQRHNGEPFPGKTARLLLVVVVGLIATALGLAALANLVRGVTWFIDR